MSQVSKINYSVFGNTKVGYKRFLYDAYLPYDHPAQGVHFVLNPERLRTLNNKVRQIESQISEKLKQFLNGEVWPVDRLITLLTTHCYLNAMERVKCLLMNEQPDNLRFIALFNSPQINPSLTVTEYIDRLMGKPVIYEQILIALLEYYGVEIKYENLSSKLLQKRHLNPKACILFLKGRYFPVRTRYLYLKSLLKQSIKYKNKKALFLVSNNVVNPDDLNDCKDDADFFDLYGTMGFTVKSQTTETGS
jgi:hypothetical protein